MDFSDANKTWENPAIPRIRLSELEFRLEVLERAVARLYDAFDEYRVANGNDDEDDCRGSFV